MTVRGAAVIMLGLASIWPGGRTQEGKTVKFFYLPFGTETRAPVTRQTIENDAVCTFEVRFNNTEAAGWKFLVTSKTASGFDDRAVRLKVVGLLPDIVFVNRDGEGIQGPGPAYRLSDGKFADLRAQMQELARTHGCPVSSASSLWDAYLQNPGAETYQPLAEALRSCREAGCSRRLLPGSPEVNRLITLVDRGDRWATDLAFLGLHLLDGGNLEDVMRSLSALSEQHPALLLQMFDGYQWSDARVERLLEMLPLSSVDDVPEQRRIVERRIKSLSTVNDPSLTRVRDVALACLKRDLEELKKRG